MARFANRHISGLTHSHSSPFPQSFAGFPQLCGIFEADVSTATYTPRSANAARGVTEVRPLRGHKAALPITKGGNRRMLRGICTVNKVWFRGQKAAMEVLGISIFVRISRTCQCHVCLSDIASKRLHLSNPTCSVSETWGFLRIEHTSASKMPHKWGRMTHTRRCRPCRARAKNPCVMRQNKPQLHGENNTL